MADDANAKKHNAINKRSVKVKHKVISEGSNVFDLDQQSGAKTLFDSVSGLKKPKIIKFKYDGNMSVGVVVPSKHPTSVSYLADVRDYNETTADIYKQIEVSRKLYTWEGIVGTVIDMFCDLASTNIRVENLKSDKAKKMINFFLKEVNRGNNNVSTGFTSLSRMLAFCNFVDGNIFLYHKWSKTQYGHRSSEVAKLPMMLVPIDPLIIKISQPSINFGYKTISIDLDRAAGGSFNAVTADDAAPLKIRKGINNKDRVIELSSDEIYHIKRRGTSFGAWGIPYLTKAFSAIASKRRLRALDDNTTDGLINSITIFRVGDAKNPATWQPSRINRLASLLSNPNPSLTLVWAYDVDVIRVGPQGDILNFSDKYNQVNQDIISALGVPMSLLTGQGDRAGDMWVSLLITMEKVNVCRLEIVECLRDLINKILIENKIYNEDPVIHIVTPKMRKEDIKTQVLSLYDKGLISKQTALEESGYDFESEILKKQEEDNDMVDELFGRPDLPYSSPINKEKVIDREETRQKDDERKKKQLRIEASMNSISNKFDTIKQQWFDIMKKHGAAYAGSWYLGRVKEIRDNVYGEFGVNINVNLLDNSYDKTNVMNAKAIFDIMYDVKTVFMSSFRKILSDI